MKAGASLLRSSGAPNERSLRFGVVEQLFLGSTVVPEASTVLATLTESGRVASEAGPAERDEERLAREICVRLLDLSRDRPLLITVDDHQFADNASVRALTYLQHRIGSSAVMLLLSQRADQSSTLSLQSLRQPYTRRFTLSALSPAGVEDLLAQRLSSEDAARLAYRCHDLTGGNPLLLRGLVDDFAGRSSTDADGPVELWIGESFTRAVLACLHRGGPYLVDTARALAVLGEFATPSLLARFLDVRPSGVSSALRALEVAGLTSGCRFRYAGTRKTVLDELTAEDHSSLHLRAAELLHHDGAAPSDIVGYLLAAGEAEEPWAVGVLRAAADHALAHAEHMLVLGEVGEAVRYLEFASRACSDERQRATLTARLVWVQWLINPAAATRHHGPLQAALEKGLLSDIEAMRLVRSLAWHGRLDEAARALECVGGLPDSATQPDPAERNLTRQWFARCFPQLLAVAEHAGVLSALLRPATRRPVPHAHPPRVVGRPAAVESAEQVLQGSRVFETQLAAVDSALYELVAAEDFERAMYWCNELLREAERHRAATWQAVLLDGRAAISLRLGDLADAERDARTALSILSPQSWGVVIGSPLSHLVQAATMMGRFDEAAKYLDHAIPQSMGHTRYRLQYLTARGHFYLATDRPHAALGDFQVVGDLAVKWKLDDPVMLAWRGDMAQALARMGRTDRARELADAQLALIGAGPARARGISLGVLASVSDIKQRLSMLGEAVDLLQEGGDRYQLAQTFAELEQVWQILGELERARLIRRRALQLAKRCHAMTLYDRLLTSREPLNAGCASQKREQPEGMALLSEAERRVATLAALGRTNREIGRKLHITVSTVEQHLTRVYRKLNIKRRTDLPVVLPADIADTA